MRIKQIVDDEVDFADRQMAFGIASLVLVLMISPIIIFLVSICYFSRVYYLSFIYSAVLHTSYDMLLILL